MEGSQLLSPEDIELNNIVSAKMLFKSDFEPQPQSDELTKKLLQLRLNGEYHDAMLKYKKVREKEEEQRLREGRR